MCLFQLIVYKREEVQIVRSSKQLNKTFSKAEIVKGPFENIPVKDFAILAFIDEYNQNINHFDRYEAWLEILGDYCFLKG